MPSFGDRGVSFQGLRLARPQPLDRTVTMQRDLPGTLPFDLRSVGGSEALDAEGLSVMGVRAPAPVPALLQPLLSEVLKRHKTRVFSGNPVDFPEWKTAWEGFLEAAKTAANGAPIPDKTALVFLENWLDDASRRKLRTRRSQNPDLSYASFFQELAHEVGIGATTNRRNKWREVKLHLPNGELSFAAWRNFKSAVEESLVGVDPPLDEDRREHLLKQVPPTIRREVASRETSVLRNSPQVTLKLPPRVPRPMVLETVGEALGLRVRDDPRQPEYLKVDCLNEEVQRRALELDGMKLVDAEGQVQGVLGVEMIRSTPLTYGEICATIEARLWGDVELARMPTVEREVESHGRSKVQKVQANPPATSSNEKGGKGGKGKGPSSSPRSPQASGRGRSVSPSTPVVCYPCQRAGRPCEHPYRDCLHWLKSQERQGKGSSSPASPRKPKGEYLGECLT